MHKQISITDTLIYIMNNDITMALPKGIKNISL